MKRWASEEKESADSQGHLRELVRCKDCKWGVNIGYGWYVCRMLVSGKHLGDWYCADAKGR